MRENFPAFGFTRFRDALGINRNHNTLRAKPLGRLSDELRIKHCAGIDANLVGTGVEHVADILQFANAATDSQRNEYLARNGFDGMYGRAAFAAAGGDVEKGNFVGALITIPFRNFDRVTRIADVHEFDALHDSAVVAVKTRDYAFGKTHD